MNPSQIARMALGDLADMEAHAAMVEKFRQQAIERLKLLVDAGETSALEEVRQSELYQTFKNTTGHEF